MVINFDEALTESQTVFPMAHVDVNDNGVYEFNGSDVTTDQPATTEDGEVAVIPVEKSPSADHRREPPAPARPAGAGQAPEDSTANHDSTRRRPAKR